MKYLRNKAFINQISSFSSKLSLLEKKIIFRENFPKASKKNEMHFLHGVTSIFPPVITQQVNGAEWSCRVGG